MSKVFKSWEESGIDYNPRRTGEQKALCPQCSHTRKDKSEKCLSVNQGKGTFNCHHCGWAGAIITEDKPYTPEKKYIKPVVYTGPLSEKARVFFTGRGIEERTLEYFKIGQESRGISFPYYETIKNGDIETKELINVKFRAEGKKFQMSSGAKLIFFNLDAIKDGKEAIITEGEMDCLSLYQCDFFNAVSVPNGASKGSQKLEYLDNCIDYFEGKTKIILAVDNDEAGLSLQNELIRRLGHERCYTITYPEGCKDANEALMKHGKQAVKEMIRGAQPIPLEGIYDPNEIESLAEYTHKYGYPTGDKIGYIHQTGSGVAEEGSFDDLMSFALGQLTVVTGIPGHGKSNFVDQVMTRLASRCGWRFGIFSFEQPAEYQTSALIEKYVGGSMDQKNFPQDYMSHLKMKKGVAFVNEHFHLAKENGVDTTIEGILEKAREMVMRFGIKGFLIDPYNYIEYKAPTQMSETQYICWLLNKIKAFTRIYKVHIFLVAHPRKMGKDKEGKEEAPNLYDIAGSAHFRNITDNGITVYRDFQSNEVTVYVQKVRWKSLGRTGFAVFKYHVPSGRYTTPGCAYEMELREGDQVAIPAPEPPREKGELTDFKYMALGEPQF